MPLLQIDLAVITLFMITATDSHVICLRAPSVILDILFCRPYSYNISIQSISPALSSRTDGGLRLRWQNELQGGWFEA